MKERDCANCKHHTSDGCSSWGCEFEAKDLISRADAIEAVASITMSIHLSEVICDKLLALPSADTVQGEWLDGWEVIRELSETRCMYNCFDENDRPMYEAMTSAIDIVRQMMGGARMKGGDTE